VSLSHVKIPRPSPLTPCARWQWCAAPAAALAALLGLLVTVAPAAPAASARDNFEKHCVDCHGADGKSQTRLGRKAGAKDLTDAKTMAKLSDAEVFKTIKFGRKNAKGEEKMDAFADGLTDQEITALVAYVRTLAK
jgi:mono/diheme cytochrome c family protein